MEYAGVDRSNIKPSYPLPQVSSSIHNSICEEPPNAQELRSLFLFSFLLSLSIRFLFIFSANFWYRSFSSLAARLSLICVIRLCVHPVISQTCHAYRLRNVCRTFLSASFSSFNSFSLAFTAICVTLSLARFAYVVSPEPGRKAFLGACHCFPV